MFDKFASIFNLILAVSAVGIGVYVAQFVRASKVRRGLQIGAVMAGLAWLSIQWHGGCR